MKPSVVKYCVPVSAAVLLLLSCATGIPGEQKLILENLASEYYALAEGYMGLSNYPKAIEYYEKMMRHPDFAGTARFRLARAYGLSGDWNKAAQLYEELLEEYPGNIYLKSAYAYVIANNGRKQEALEMYRSLADENEHDIDLLKNYITLCVVTEDFARAREGLGLLEERFPGDAAAAEMEKRISDGEEKAAQREAGGLEPDGETELPAD